jgi:hypothetical protein
MIVYSVKEYGFYSRVYKKRGKPLNQPAIRKTLLGYDECASAIGFASGSSAVKHIRANDNFRFYPE